MLWLTWRQHRVQIVSMLLGAIALAITIGVIAAYARSARIELGVDSCVPLPTTNMNCYELDAEWQRRVGPARLLFLAFYLVPALIGSYVGGPLFARELERGTHRLAWTQGISRLGWGATKLGVLLLVALGAGLILAAVGGQTRHLMGVSGYRPWDTFDQEGPAFLSFIAFGLVAGALIGAWSRRILTGMFFGLLVFFFVRGVVIFELRPSYQPPVAVPMVGGVPFGVPFQAQVPSDAWILGADAVDARGRPVPQERVRELMDEFSRTGVHAGQTRDSVTYLAAQDVYQRILYQPADRYRRFQLTEAAIYIVLTAALTALTFWTLRRRDA